MIIKKRAIMTIDNNTKGAFFMALGIVLFIAFAGKLFLHLVGILVSLFIINYGLQLKKQPSLISITKNWIKQVINLKI
jgi:hypothetical protein